MKPQALAMGAPMTDEERALQAILSTGEPQPYTDTPTVQGEPGAGEGGVVRYAPSCGCPPMTRAAHDDPTRQMVGKPVLQDGQEVGRVVRADSTVTIMEIDLSALGSTSRRSGQRHPRRFSR